MIAEPFICPYCKKEWPKECKCDLAAPILAKALSQAQARIQELEGLETMTPDEIQELQDRADEQLSQIDELRRWSAEKMGWDIGVKDYPRPGCGYIYNRGEDVMRQSDWHPDTDLNQCFMLVEKMREEGWDFQMNNYADDNEGYQARFLNYELPDFVWDIKTLKVEKEEEIKLMKSLSEIYKPWSISTNPALAILLAARSTEET